MEDCVVGRVGFEYAGENGIVVCKNRRGSEGFLECFERGLTRIVPDKWCVLAGEPGEGYDDS